MSQRELAQRVGVAAFMMSKYELGGNGLSASLLYEIAGQLAISPEYFFEGFEDPRSTELPAKQRLLLSLVRSSGQIRSKVHLEALAHIVRVLAGNEQGRI